MDNVTEQTPMREIEIFGIPALFSEQKIPHEIIFDMHCYDLFSAEDGVIFLGSVLTPIPVEVPEGGERNVYDDDLMLDTAGKMLSPKEFAEKYLSPVDGPDLEERLGKND